MNSNLHHPSRPITILPSLLYPDVSQMQQKATEYQSLVDTVHIDFADGQFVPNVLPSLADVQSLHTTLQFEAHLMVSQPTDWVEQALTDPRFTTIVVHLESQAPIAELLQKIRSQQRHPALAINPQTPVEALDPYLSLLDQVTVMTVNPGFNGSPFLPECLDKVAQLAQQHPQLTIACDGGINPQTISAVTQAGATKVAIGSYFHNIELSSGLQQLKSAIV